MDKLVLNKEYPLTHKYADAVLGKGHRKKWGHTLVHTALLFLLTKRVDYAISHMLHILADKMETKNKALFELLDLYIRAKKRKR